MFRRGNIQAQGSTRAKRPLRSSVLRLGSLALLASVFSVGAAVSVPEGNRALKIYHVHTGEKQVIVFKRNGVYDKD
ncbi:hypothetical protein, partial [Devosia sp.]|uniref:hypothetical protein n=1 Tax=Devosia sp. TaxID=1871048 RepID=UPI0025BC067E